MKTKISFERVEGNKIYFLATSESTPGIKYKIVGAYDHGMGVFIWKCSCPDYGHRSDDDIGYECKHIRELKHQIYLGNWEDELKTVQGLRSTVAVTVDHFDPVLIKNIISGETALRVDIPKDVTVKMNIVNDELVVDLDGVRVTSI